MEISKTALIKTLFCELTDLLVLNEVVWNRSTLHNVHAVTLECILNTIKGYHNHNNFKCAVSTWHVSQECRRVLYMYWVCVIVFYYWISIGLVVVGGSLLSKLGNWYFSFNVVVWSGFYFYYLFFILLYFLFLVWMVVLGIEGLRNRFNGRFLVHLFRSNIDRSFKQLFIMVDVSITVMLFIGYMGRQYSPYTTYIDMVIMEMFKWVSYLLLLAFLGFRCLAQRVVFLGFKSTYVKFIWILQIVLTVTIVIHCLIISFIPLSVISRTVGQPAAVTLLY